MLVIFYFELWEQQNFLMRNESKIRGHILFLFLRMEIKYEDRYEIMSSFDNIFQINIRSKDVTSQRFESTLSLNYKKEE